MIQEGAAIKLDPALVTLVGGRNVDTDSLREKYRIERSKRLPGSDALSQTLVTAAFSNAGSDPHVAAGFQRAALADEVVVVSTATVVIDVVALRGTRSGI